MQIKFGGVSIKGSHLINQDSFSCGNINDITFLVLSDGLGSKKFSDIGSKAICDIIYDSIIKDKNLIEDIHTFIDFIHNEWVNRLSAFNLDDYLATCLICIIKENEVTTAQLGDGFICVFDEYNQFISRGNEMNYINETDSLSYNLNLNLWNINTFIFPEELTVIMCSDGICINENDDCDILDFCKELSLEYQNYSSDVIQNKITSWLNLWKGSDDKTLIFFIRK